MSSFKNRLFGSPVPKVIRDRFKKLEGPSVIEDPLAAQNPSFDEYLGSRTPFARMWTAISIEQFSETPPNGEQIHKYSNEEAPDDVMPMIISWLGNSSVATVPTLLDLILKNKVADHKIEEGDLVIFASVGAGMNINAAVYQF